MATTTKIMATTTKRNTTARIPTTLPEAVDFINEADFYRHSLPKRIRAAAAVTIAERLGGESAFSGGFALTTEERTAGFRVFTGEVMTHAAARHIATEEATRALRLLQDALANVRETAEEGNRRLVQGLLARVDAKSDGTGTVCCGNCDVSAWRHLAAGGLNRPGDRLPFAMRWLHNHREGKGGWRRHPLYYTVLALTEIVMLSDVATYAAIAKLEYAAPASERRLHRLPAGETPYAQRRLDVLQRALDLL